VEGKCYLHTVDSCCGQFGKKEANLDWTSGYVCPRCWSTLSGTDCPCAIDERAVIPKTAHGAGGKSPKHATSSVSKLNYLNVLKMNCSPTILVQSTSR
jgi:hypothetical protein